MTQPNCKASLKKYQQNALSFRTHEHFPYSSVSWVTWWFWAFAKREKTRPDIVTTTHHQSLRWRVGQNHIYIYIWCIYGIPGREINLYTVTYNVHFYAQGSGQPYSDIEHDDIEHDDIEHDDIEHDDIEHDDIEHDDIEHDDIEHDDIEHGDIEHDDIEHDDIEHDDIEHDDIEHSYSIQRTTVQYRTETCKASNLLTWFHSTIMAWKWRNALVAWHSGLAQHSKLSSQCSVSHARMHVRVNHCNGKVQ